MKLKHIAIMAALMMAGQSWALTAYEKNHGCNTEGEGCANGSLGGGGGGNVTATPTEVWVYGGSVWEGYEDSEGGFEIETNLSTGKKTVHFVDKAALLIKPAPPREKMKRSELVYGTLVTAESLAQAKKKAEEAKAQAAAQASGAAAAAAQKAQAEAVAAKKAADAKAAADAIQKAGGVGAYSSGLSGPVSSAPAGMSNAPAMGAQPAAGVSAGPIAARKKP
jgi:hypothetical protein